MRDSLCGVGVDGISLPIAHAKEEYIYSLETGFINADAHPDAALAPELLVNDGAASVSVYSALLREFKICDRFDFSVAFISCTGVEMLTEAFSRLAEKSIPGRILTTTYLDFNDPDALAKINDYSNIDVRVYDGSLHTKGYFFAMSTCERLLSVAQTLPKRLCGQTRNGTCWSVPASKAAFAKLH